MASRPWLLATKRSGLLSITLIIQTARWGQGTRKVTVSKRETGSGEDDDADGRAADFGVD